MQHSKYFIIPIMAISALSLNINAFADDGLTPGPGLFSGESGEFNLGKILHNDKQVSSSDRQVLKQVVASTDTNSTVRESNYSAYKEWRELHEQNPNLYDSFDVWLEYKTYLKQK